jgi:hypothetical protein
MVPHVLSSTNCGLGCFKKKYFLCTNSHFLSGLTTVQVVDPLPMYRDFPDDRNLFLVPICIVYEENKGQLAKHEK